MVGSDVIAISAHTDATESARLLIVTPSVVVPARALFSAPLTRAQRKLVFSAIAMLSPNPLCPSKMSPP